ncbi:MAG: lipopolysaccharide assembly protein LapA domain-containing protein, partial [Desertimonas sp.]
IIVAGVITILALIFVLQNTGSARVNLLWADIDMPAWLWMALLFLGGMIVGSIFPWFRRRKD